MIKKGLKISRILHAGYIFEYARTQIAFDPIFESPFSSNCFAYPSIEFNHDQIRKLKFSAVFISHYHDDHCSLESLNLLNRQTPIFIYCLFEEIISLIRKLGFKQVFPLTLNKKVQLGSIEVTPRRALDVDVDCIFQIRAAGFNILNVVDSWIDYSTLSLLLGEGPWDLILWPFQTMRELEVLAPTRSSPANGEIPEELLEQLKLLNPRYLIPSSCQFVYESWSWYNKAFFPVSYKSFAQQVRVQLPNVKIKKMNPGASFELKFQKLSDSNIKFCQIVPAGSLKWIRPLKNQDLDYEYDPTFVPPPTSEIAKRFSNLSEEQTDRIKYFLKKEIPLKFPTLEPLLDCKYFDSPRLWRLAVYNSFGVPEYYNYEVSKNKLKIIDSGCIEFSKISWFTEVIGRKLYGALEQGESLTSMYLRINDHLFSPKVEQEIAGVDVGIDPLLRCLFQGEVGSYQKAQLQRIQISGSKLLGS